LILGHRTAARKDMHVDMAVLRMLREMHDVGLLAGDELVGAPRHVTEQRSRVRSLLRHQDLRLLRPDDGRP
jgi:hypothetical protein